MHTLAQLTSLERLLRGERVLSVFLDGTVDDPAKQRARRAQLDRAIDELRDWLADSSHAEREAFEQCVRQLYDELARLPRGVGAPGWAAFITPDRVRLAEPLPVPMPTRAVWSTGASIAPYMRALKEVRPVIVAVVDSRRTNVYQYQLGALRRVTTVHAHHALRQPSHMGASANRGFHPGTRGETGHDAAQRSLLEGRQRMLDRAAERIEKLAGAEAWVLVGGIPEVARALRGRLPGIGPRRIALFEGLDVHASRAELVRAARSAASSLRNEVDRAAIADISDHQAAEGVGALGPAETQRTLEEARVRALYITHQYLEDHGADAEDAVRAALHQGAAVEEVSGNAAKLLDAHGGMAARLRYRRA